MQLIRKMMILMAGAVLLAGCTCGYALKELKKTSPAAPALAVQDYDLMLKEYRQILEKYQPDAGSNCFTENDAAIKNIEKLREEAFFKELKAENSIEAYERYLYEHPYGQFVSAAKELRNKLWFQTDMNFDRGIQFLALFMKAQMMKHQAFDKLFPDPKPRPAVMDPFKDTQTGQELTVNDVIENLFIQNLNQHLELVELSPKNIPEAEFVFRGILSLEKDPVSNNRRNYHIYARLDEKSSGRWIAGGDVWVGNFPYIPKPIYADMPAYPIDRNLEKMKESLADPQSEDKDYTAFLDTRSVLNEGNRLYEKGEYKEALKRYEDVSKREDGQNMAVWLGLYNIYLRLEEMEKAGDSFGKAVEIGVRENNEIFSKFLFDVNSAYFRKDKKLFQAYELQLLKISEYLKKTETCVRITGHVSRTGDPNHLSKRRAENVQRMMAETFPEIYRYSEAAGMGYAECVKCTVPDSDENAIDRRVEFKIIPCKESRHER
jgi:outer membrane protein OmpA-like peptidoglycan-associated protein